jgi:hypothetical protein
MIFNFKIIFLNLFLINIIILYKINIKIFNIMKTNNFDSNYLNIPNQFYKDLIIKKNIYQIK